MSIKVNKIKIESVSESTPIEEITPVGEAKLAIDNLSRNLAGLRQFVALLEPAATQQVIETTRKHETDLLPVAMAASHFAPEVFKLNEDTLKRIKDEGLEDVIQDKAVDDKKKSLQLSIPGHYIERFQSALSAVDSAGKHPELLRRSALISLVSMVEWYLSELLHIFAKAEPHIFEHTEKEFTLAELMSFSSIEDAKSHFVEAKVENILRGSFADWIKFLSKRANLSLSYAIDVQDEMEEICNRRNLLVHNGGIVNKLYLSKTKNSDLKIGANANVSREYLDRAICLFESTFILIAAEWWKKCEPKDETRAERLTEITLEALNDDRFSTGERLSNFVMYDKELSEKSRLVGRVNYWQSIKWAGRFEEVRKEVESFDITAKEAVFLTVKNVLLDNLDEAFKEFDILIEHKQLTTEALQNWPLFRDVRKDERFKKYAEAALDSKDSEDE